MNIQDVRCFLLDMDGTFYLGENLIPGSLDFIRRVEETGRVMLEPAVREGGRAVLTCRLP